MKKRSAAELRSYRDTRVSNDADTECVRVLVHTGCAEKRIKSWLNTLPQTMAASIHAPACATTPVPSFMVSRRSSS
jgi:hypothetical protein